MIGTLLGVRSEDGLEVEIRNAYAVPHEETEDQVSIATHPRIQKYGLLMWSFF